MPIRDDPYTGCWLKALGECLVPLTKVKEIAEGVGVGKGQGGTIKTGSTKCGMPITHTCPDRNVEGTIGHSM